jgi:choline dehydrogenase
MLVPIQAGVATDKIAEKYPLPPNAFSVFVNLIDVKSKGYIKMKTFTHDGPLEIQPNFIKEAEDLEALVSAIELCMDLAMQPALKNIIKRWVAPSERNNRQEIKAFIKDACSTYFHPVGTCAMGNGKDAVVNNELKVYGIEGLRIADASIMPQITTANTHAPTLMIGEFASQLLLKKR